MHLLEIAVRSHMVKQWPRHLLRLILDKREHALNFTSYFVSRGITLALFAVTVPYFLNRVGEQAYGVVTMLFLLYGYPHVLDLGVGYSLNFRLGRAVARGIRRVHSLVRCSVPYYVALSLLVGCGMFFGGEHLSVVLLSTSRYGELFQWIGVGMAFSVLSAPCTAIMQAHNRVSWVNLSRLFLDIVRSGAMVVAVMTGGRLEHLVLTIVAGSAGKLVLDLFLAAKLLGGFGWMTPRFVRKELAFNVSFGLPATLSLVCGIMIASADKIYISRFVSLDALAEYSVASDLHTKAFFLVWAVNGSLYTVLIRRGVHGIETGSLLYISLGAVVVVFALYYVPLAIFSKGLIGWWISPAFASNSFTLVQWLLPSSVFYLVASVFENILQTRGKILQVSLGYLLAVMTLILALATLPGQWGIHGVPLAYALMHLVLMSTFIGLTMKYGYGVSPARS
jgi:O-antigen/teichoic acid export membrane protein